MQLRQDVRVPVGGRAVDKDESARVLAALEAGALELDESLERVEGQTESGPKLRTR